MNFDSQTAVPRTIVKAFSLFDGTIGIGTRCGVQNTDGLLHGDTTSGTRHWSIQRNFYSWNIGAVPFLRLALTSGAGTRVVVVTE